MKKTIIMAAFLAICFWSVLVHAQETKTDFDGKKGAAVGFAGEAARQPVRVPAASGWDLRGKLLGSPFEGLCSIASDTEIAEYWQTPFGGAEEQRFTIVASQGSLDALWEGSGLKLEKPTIDFGRYLLVVMEPGSTITQYNYRLNVKEGPGSIDFSLIEFHNATDNGVLLGQRAILAFKVSKTSKKIAVKIKKAPGSEGPYDK